MVGAKPSYGALIAVGVLGIGIVATILLLTRSKSSATSTAATQTKYAAALPMNSLPRNEPPRQYAPTGKAAMTYDNEETVEFPEGFDPVTLMPRKIVIHRRAVVTQ